MSDLVDSSGRSRRKAKGSGHLRRAEIIDAASRIFIECGYEGATIRKIADAVGVSSTALYMHFRDKREILVEICENAVGQLLAQNTEISALRMEPVGRVRRMLQAYMDFALEHPNAYRLVFCSPIKSLGSDEDETLSELGRKCFELFLGAVTRVADAGLLRGGDVVMAAQTSWAATHGLVNLLITRPDFNWAPAPALMQQMLDGLSCGLFSGSPAASDPKAFAKEPESK